MPNDKNAPTRTWTLVMDVNFDQGYQGGGYSSLFQTNTGNSGDGDIFVLESSGGIGISSTYGGTSSPQTWHRFAITAQDGVGINKYIDGVNVGSQGWQDRFEIADSDLLLFVDNATETSEVLVNSVAFYDEALSDAQLATLGAPVAGGIPAGVPVPEPTGLVLLGSAMLLGLGCRRRRA
jgi:hypothetical protein